jgi:uncharacterized RDD family membrane protein YckC
VIDESYSYSYSYSSSYACSIFARYAIWHLPEYRELARSGASNPTAGASEHEAEYEYEYEYEYDRTGSSSGYLRPVGGPPYNVAMSDREPAVLRDEAGSAVEIPPIAPRADTTPPAQRAARREAPTVHVVGFWKRAAAAVIDLAVIIPVALLVTWIVSKIAGVHLPPNNLRLTDVDLWLDLVLATDPALVMGMVLFVAIGLVYLLVSHIVLGRTLGMRVLKMRVIDVYGDTPSPRRCVVRCAGYLVSAASLFLGFLWIGFDSEKRGLQDWIAGTYVIRA